MSWRVRLTAQAASDLERLFDFLAQNDLPTAERALAAISDGFALLERFPFACRKATPDDPTLRELLIGFGRSGYVVLYEIESAEVITILAVRHQREDDRY